MKKQNVNNKLAFNKAAVTELNAAQLQTVNGGTCTHNYTSWICDKITDALDINYI